MKSLIRILAARSMLAFAAAQNLNDTVNGMMNVIQGNTPCADVAVIFARGTFDSGNIGVWVGLQFFDSLSTSLPSVALQGVDSTAYPANLSDYLSEGGSDNGAASLASTVTAYNAKCPNSDIVISGWSQGALVVHKGILQLSDTVISKVAAVVTFGDPNGVWNNLTLPSALPSGAFQSYCITGTIFDPLCAVLPGDFKYPTSIQDIIGPFASLPGLANGELEVEAAAELVVQFPQQLIQSWSSFVQNLTPTEYVRLLLTPQHFEYGNNGMAAAAATFVAGRVGS